MCGIAGVAGRGAEPERVRRMVAALAHRGPDARGLFTGPGIAIGHARLAVIDLSVEAGQPMATRDGRRCLAFNGEIFNHGELRSELPPPAGGWRTRSDTEVLLHLLDVHATQPAEAAARLDGMFAFALHDRERRELVLGRDAFGEKPLFYALEAGRLVFASTLPALLLGLDATPEIDEGALANVVRFGAVAGPETIYQGIRRIPPGHLASFRDGVFAIRPFAAVDDDEVRSRAVSFGEAVEQAHDLLLSSVRRRLVADVPVGCFLSGGVDSALVTALAARERGVRLRTFSAGFDVPSHDERRYAGEVIRRYDLEHSDVVVTSESLESLPKLISHVGEPFGDPSIVPTYEVSRLARRHVTVVLTGDGGDELFGGYDTGLAAHLASRYRAALPAPLRSAVAWAARRADRALGSPITRRARRFAEYAACEPLDGYRGLLTHLWGGREARLFKPGPFDAVARGRDWIDRHASDPANGAAEPFRRVLDAEIRGQLADLYLVKVDVATMAVSLEARCPFLDRGIARLCRSLPGSILYRRGVRKAVLKEVAARYVPRSLVTARKRGFTVPIGAWLREPRYRATLEALGSPRAALARWFDPAVVREAIGEHLARRADHGPRLFSLIGIEIFLRLCVDRSAEADTPLSDLLRDAGRIPAGARA